MSVRIMKKTEIALFAIVALAFVTGIALYPSMPSVVATHWNAQGAVNGSMSRVLGVFLFPVILLLVAVIFFVVPRIDPKRGNIEKFRKYFDCFAIEIVALLYYIYVLSLVWNLGYQFDFKIAIAPALAGLFYVIGALLPHTEQNWMVGIRTPWTISSETVWKRTHAAGGTALKICAVLAVIGMLFPAVLMWFLLAPIIIVAVGLTVYSYVLYEKEEKHKKRFSK